MRDRRCFTADNRPKKRYGKRRDARQAIRARQDQYPDYDGKPYRCPVCGYFHVGRYPTNPITRSQNREAHRIAAA